MVGFIGKNRKNSTGYEPAGFENFLITLTFLTKGYEATSMADLCCLLHGPAQRQPVPGVW